MAWFRSWQTVTNPSTLHRPRKEQQRAQPDQGPAFRAMVQEVAGFFSDPSRTAAVMFVSDLDQ